MKKIGFANIGAIRLEDRMDIGVYEIGGVDYVILGGEFSTEGVRNYLRPYDKVVENLSDLQHYSRTRKDVEFYMDNKSVLKCNEVVKDLRYDMERQKW
jgi:hypothetical protein